ncbi:MAG: HAD family phosphatase [Firmicutes bacterium]|nr:HAD family phosphatase [Bacillota bacterium]
MALKDTKLAIFDMDGLLIESERLIAEHWMKLAERDGLDKDKVWAACLGSLGVTPEKVREVAHYYLGADFPYDAYQTEVEENIRKELDGGPMPVKKGAFEMLEYLKRIGLPAVVASSNPKRVVTELLGGNGLLPYFTEVFGGDAVTRSKPNPDLFLYAASSMGVAPANCVVFEDSFNGIRAAHAAGMMSIMVPDLLQPTEEISALYTAKADDLGAAAEMLLEAFLE